MARINAHNSFAHKQSEISVKFFSFIKCHVRYWKVLCGTVIRYFTVFTVLYGTLRYCALITRTSIMDRASEQPSNDVNRIMTVKCFGEARSSVQRAAEEEVELLLITELIWNQGLGYSEIGDNRASSTQLAVHSATQLETICTNIRSELSNKLQYHTIGTKQSHTGMDFSLK